jgi:hypothetical protein
MNKTTTTLIIWLMLFNLIIVNIVSITLGRFRETQMKFNQAQTELNREQTINAQLQGEFNSKVLEVIKQNEN